MHNLSTLACGDGCDASGVAAVMIGSLVASLVRSGCDIADNNHFPPDKGHREQSDFVIVGAGTAGCVLATRLTEDPDVTVAVLEAGADPPMDSYVPANFFELQHTEVDWSYKTEPQDNAFLGFKDRKSSWPRGKTLGGSSSINGMLYVRGHKGDYDRWAAHGNPGWDYASVLPYFRRSEDVREPDLVASEFHGTGGPLPVSRFGGWTPLMQALLDATVQTGLPENTDINGASQDGFNRAQVTAFNGTRYSAARSFLTQARDRDNLHLVKQAHVTRIIFEGVRAVAVEYERNGVRHSIKANKEVILSAGSIGSPHILLLSGVGPSEQLESVGIPVVRNVRGVGENLQDHPLFVAPGISIKHDSSIENAMDSTLAYLRERSGYLSNVGLLSVNGFLRTKYADSDYPDIQIHHFGPFVKGDENTADSIAYRSLGYTQEIRDALFHPILNEERDMYLASPTLLRPKSVGKILLNDSDPMSKPIIQANFFENSDDVDTLAEAALWVLNMSRAEALEPFDARPNTAVIPGCESSELHSLEYWKCAVRVTASTTYHPVGTCKMGPSEDEFAVVDHELRVVPTGNDDERHSLSQDLGVLLEEDEAPCWARGDVMLRAAGGSQVPAHRCILGTRSPRLAALLDHLPVTAASTSPPVLELDDLTSEVLQELLRYIYTGRIENIDALAPPLIAAATKYELPGLVALCERSLLETLNSESVAARLLLADEFGCETLKRAALAYCSEGHRMPKNVAWTVMEMVNPELFQEACEAGLCEDSSASSFGSSISDTGSNSR